MAERRVLRVLVVTDAEDVGFNPADYRPLPRSVAEPHLVPPTNRAHDFHSLAFSECRSAAFQTTHGLIPRHDCDQPVSPSPRLSQKSEGSRMDEIEGAKGHHGPHS